MAEKKITKKQNFEDIMNYLAENGKTEWAEVMAHEIELLDRKASKGGSLSAAQKENMVLLEVVKDVLAENEGTPDYKGMTIGELLKDERIAKFETANPNGVSSQRLTSIMSPLAKEGGDFVREVIKKVAYFRLAYGEVEGV